MGGLFRDEFGRLNNFLGEKGLNIRGNETRDPEAAKDEDGDEKDDEDEEYVEDDDDVYEPSDEDEDEDDKDATMGTDPGDLDDE